MIRIPRLCLLLGLAALVAATVASPAHAAKRKVPFGFFSVTAPPEMFDSSQVSDLALEAQFGLMARSGVESVRVTPAWNALEGSLGAYDFRTLDRIVAAASRRRIATLINPTATPAWISSRPNSPEASRYPPRSAAPYAELMRQLVLRYGPSGTFWAQNPGIPRVPVRYWQIWNEQNAPWHWRQRRWARGYTNLLKAAYRAIKGVDRGATVIAGSVVAAPNRSQWGAVRQMYRAGAKRWFDALAVHPFTNNERSVSGTTAQLLEIIRRVRNETRSRRDGKAPIMITELSWPASVGSIPRRAHLGIETTKRGQVQRLQAGYRTLARVRRKLRITGAYWYTWATEYDNNSPDSVMSFRYAGLTRLRAGQFTRMPILRTYTRVAARYEGCRKSANARRCR
jgi:Beta-galactosidase